MQYLVCIVFRNEDEGFYHFITEAEAQEFYDECVELNASTNHIESILMYSATELHRKEFL